MKQLELGPTTLLQAKSLIEDLEKIGVAFTTRLVEPDNVVPERNLFGMTTQAKMVAVNVDENDYVANRQLFGKHQFKVNLQTSNAEDFKQLDSSEESHPAKSKTIFSKAWSFINLLMSIYILSWFYFEFQKIDPNPYYLVIGIMGILIQFAIWFSNFEKKDIK